MAVDGINSASGLGKELQIAQQNQQSAVKGTDAKTSAMAAALSKLNSLYSSNGANTAKGVTQLIAQQLELKALESTDSDSSSDSSGSTSPAASAYGTSATGSSSSGNLFDTQL